jgi:hypothetical protein
MRLTGKALGRTLLVNVVPAYVAPLVMVSIAARSIPDRTAGRALAQAAPTTIAIPSAVAAMVVTVVLWRRPSRRTALKSSVLAGLICGFFAAAASGILVGNHGVASRLFVDAVPSAALGGAISSAKLTRVRKST